MDQFYLDSIALIGFMIIWFIFAIIVYLLHTVYRIYKTKKISDSFEYVFKMHARMFCKFYITTMLFFIFCAFLKSIVE
jgi:hypothetical protein